MSLMPFDDIWFAPSSYVYRQPQRRRQGQWGVLPYGGVISNVLNEGLREMQRLERELGTFGPSGDLGISGQDGNNYSFKCNVAGYAPEELSVDLENDELVVSGEHKQQGDGQTLHRTFVRRVALPGGFERDSINCNIDEKGQLEITAKPKGLPASQKTNIPIGFRQSEQGQLGQGQGQPQGQLSATQQQKQQQKAMMDGGEQKQAQK